MLNERRLATSRKLRSPLKWHGGKSYLARRIIGHFKPHDTYCEPFAGGLSVLLNKEPARHETVGDIDAKLMLFWAVLADDDRFWEFRQHLGSVKYDQSTFDHAKAAVDFVSANPWECEAINWARFAAYYLIRNRMSRGGLGKDFAWSERLRGGKPGDLNAWETTLAGLPMVRKRIQSVRIVPVPALRTIEACDGPDTLHYVDPPYLHTTRTAKNTYAFEMTEADHAALLDTLRSCRGMVCLSGYANPLYDAALSDWNRVEFEIANHSGQGKTKQRRIECLWMNY